MAYRGKKSNYENGMFNQLQKIMNRLDRGKINPYPFRNQGYGKGGKYVTKYVINLKTETVITKLHIYADEHGRFHIPPQYRSDVTYVENVKALAVFLTLIRV